MTGLRGNSREKAILNHERCDHQVSELRQPIGDYAAVALCVIAFKAHKAGPPRRHQLDGDVDVPQGRLCLHMASKDSSEQAIIPCARRVATILWITESA